MAKIIDFPTNYLSEKDKKLIRMQNYIQSNLIDLATKRKELIDLKNRIEKLLRKSNLSVVKNEAPDGNK